ncbi:MAG: hypothetical protein PHF97_07445 [Bacteroidales bacterium]|nr:hypothetical protein [Bacteroidales bacterium]MDD4603625.1 hypothetical protein [Bacteroidales bacterium]
MPTDNLNPKSLIQAIIDKGGLKQEVYNRTLETFNSFKSSGKKLVHDSKKKIAKSPYPIPFDFSERGKFEFQLKFGSDILIFFMHSNVFEIPRDHAVMKTGYIHEDKTRSYCGIIHVFNFLADSFKYNRINDIGYCIGRIFINREGHYFIEGKREIGLLYNNFPTSQLDQKSIKKILHSAILYTLNFDLLTPPFDNVKEVTVVDMQTTLDTFAISTGKRIGYRFQEDGL